MKAFQLAKWIWLHKENKKDEYGEFFAPFFPFKKKALCRISCDGDYTLFLNGKYVSSNQYGDFEHYKVYDEIDITEYLEENYPEPRLLPGDNKQRAEIRRLCDWFDTKFYKEVYQYIVVEKIYKRFKDGLAPDSKILKAGLNNLKFHIYLVPNQLSV